LNVRDGDFASKFLEVKIVATDAEIFNDVGEIPRGTSPECHANVISRSVRKGLE
jgi:hypothetical protein